MSAYIEIPNRNPVGGGGGVAWGSITGTLSGQGDLQAALDAKASTASQTFSGVVTIGIGNTAKHSLNTATSAAGIGLGTISNMPAGVSGNPAGFVSIMINGASRVIPFW